MPVKVHFLFANSEGATVNLPHWQSTFIPAFRVVAAPFGFLGAEGHLCLPNPDGEVPYLFIAAQTWATKEGFEQAMADEGVQTCLDDVANCA